MKIRFAAPARALNNEDGTSITDVGIIRTLDGAESDETFADYFDDATKDLGVSGGRLRFYFDDRSQRLWAETIYEASRELTEAEMNALTEYTKGQWSDGIGENFSQAQGEETGIFLEPMWEGLISVDVRAS
jgi:hypothetical protein